MRRCRWSRNEGMNNAWRQLTEGETDKLDIGLRSPNKKRFFFIFKWSVEITWVLSQMQQKAVKGNVLNIIQLCHCAVCIKIMKLKCILAVKVFSHFCLQFFTIYVSRILCTSFLPTFVLACCNVQEPRDSTEKSKKKDNWDWNRHSIYCQQLWQRLLTLCKGNCIPGTLPFTVIRCEGKLTRS